MGGVNTGSVGTPKVVNHDEQSIDLSVGTYATPADIVAAIVAQGYAGGKSKVHQIQVTADKGGYAVTGQGESADAGSGESFTREGNSSNGAQLQEVDDFELVVTVDTVNVRVLLF